MEQQVYKTEGVNRTQTMRFHPFVFTGKERDAETGYSYFGARYYDSDLFSLFLSVDPMADKYPSISPYAYCAWNPIKIIDPCGDTISMYLLNSSEDNQYFLNNLSKKTGLSLRLDNGNVMYDKDEDGKAIFEGGSESARSDLLECIDAEFKCIINIADYSEICPEGMQHAAKMEKQQARYG